jgi:hypothetical protein
LVTMPVRIRPFIQILPLASQRPISDIHSGSHRRSGFDKASAQSGVRQISTDRHG